MGFLRGAVPEASLVLDPSGDAQTLSWQISRQLWEAIEVEGSRRFGDVTVVHVFLPERAKTNDAVVIIDSTGSMRNVAAEGMSSEAQARSQLARRSADATMRQAKQAFLGHRQ